MSYRIWLLGVHRVALRLLSVVLLLTNSAFAEGKENLIRNGSFEGSLLYWHSTDQKEIVEEGKTGRFAMRIDGGWTLSAPMPLEKDTDYTISLWARTVRGEGSVVVGMPPMAREVAQKSKRIWKKKRRRVPTLRRNGKGTRLRSARM